MTNSLGRMKTCSKRVSLILAQSLQLESLIWVDMPTLIIPFWEGIDGKIIGIQAGILISMVCLTAFHNVIAQIDV